MRKLYIAGNWKMNLVPSEAAKYAAKMNLTIKKGARPGYLCEMEYNGNLHLGYMVDRWNVLHATQKGVRLTYIGACKAKAFYKVEKI